VRSRLSPLARSDFDGIIDFLTDEAGPGVAARYGRDIQRCLTRIAAFPLAGSPRASLGNGVRSARVAPYLIFYDIADDGEVVRILRILHERRDIGPTTLR